MRIQFCYLLSKTANLRKIVLGIHVLNLSLRLFEAVFAPIIIYLIARVSPDIPTGTHVGLSVKGSLFLSDLKNFGLCRYSLLRFLSVQFHASLAIGFRVVT
jgi:hypothetical protein